ncbi:MAG: hypothetical protein NC548_60310 [Lachnospiraceae bacterium]|nr:hypothetical protein [Lachnospiraceae bacterium]
MVKDIERIDANVKMLRELFEKGDAQILKEKKMKDLNGIFVQVYGFKMPSHIQTKADALNQLRHYYLMVKRGAAFGALQEAREA